jgi:hypothetical protein
MDLQRIRRITASDLLTIIEDVGFGKAAIGGADQRIFIDGYLDLAGMAERINALLGVRMRSRQLIDNEQPR